jgi:hypothetical protein
MADTGVDSVVTEKVDFDPEKLFPDFPDSLVFGDVTI